MSKELQQPDAPAIATDEPPSLSDRVKGLSEAGRAEWQLHGDIDAAERIDSKTSDAPAAPSPAPEPAASPGETGEEPGPSEQEPQPKKERSNRQWRNEVVKLKDAEIQRLQRELDQAKRESAERRPSAPPAEKPPEAEPGRPKRPRMRDFDGQPNALDNYEAALDAYETARDKWRDDSHSQTRQLETVESRWQEQQTGAKAKYKDFEQVAFSDDVPASFSSIPRLKQRADGAEIAYYLGKNKEVATKIAELSHIPGIDTPEKYRDFLRRSMTDPQVAGLRARAEALADFAFDQISAELRAPAASTRNGPSAPRPRPSSEVAVEGNGRVVSDPKKEAAVRKDFVTYERLANEEDIRRARR